MEKRNIINLQGRDFVTYEGLLDEAHAKGLKSIRTQLVQVPADENGQTAICTAEVTLDGEGGTRVFTGIGDACPRNVNRSIANHVIRMAETRAKARALRDAINVGMTALEELGEGAEEGSGRTLSVVTQAAKADLAQLATRSQIEKVSQEMQRTGFSPDQGRTYLQEQFGKSSRLELTTGEIDQFLKYLKKLPAKAASS